MAATVQRPMRGYSRSPLPASPPPPPTGTFTVSGGYLIDPTGAKMIPEGTGVWDYNASDQIGSLTILQNNTGYPLKNVMPKANYIRVMVFPTNHSSTSFTFPPTSAFTTIASYAAAAHIVVEFEDHSSNGSYWELGIPGGMGNTPTPSYPPTGAALASNLTFWTAMANQFKNNPYVWFGSLNELNTGDGSYSKSAIAAISTYELAFYNNIRATGATNIVDLQAGAIHPGTLGPDSGLSTSAYAGMTNIIYFLHYYQDGVTSAQALAGLKGTTVSPQDGGNGCSGFTCAQLIHSADGVVPLIYNEWGPASDQNPNDTAGQPLATAMASIQASGIGSAGFLFWNPNGGTYFQPG